MSLILRRARDIVKQKVVIIGTAGGATKITISAIFIAINGGRTPVLTNYTNKIKATIKPIMARSRINLPEVVWKRAGLFLTNTKERKIYPF
jgi:hypothetical protein